MRRKDRKVHTLTVPSGSERVRTTRPDLPLRSHQRQLVRGKDQSAEWRQVQAYRIGLAMHRLRIGVNLSRVANAAAAILHRVGVDALAIAPRPWHPYPIILARNWGEVADDDCDFVRIPAAPQIGHDALGRVRDVDPLNPLRFAIET